MKNEAPKTTMDLFRIQEAKINEDVAEAEKYYDRVIVEQEKLLTKTRVEREKAAAILASMIADYEKIDAELEAEEMKRLDSADLTKQALVDGRIGAAEYFVKGLTAAEIQVKLQAVAGEKLADLRSAVRAKAIKLLEAEAAELEAEHQIAFARQAPAATMRERLAGLLIALESSLRSPIGVCSLPDVGSRWEAKKRDLRNARVGWLPGYGSGWKDYDLAGLKRLRLDPCWPEDQLSELEKIIAEAKITGRTCRVMLDYTNPKNPVNVMWS
ncbi:MAG: hypothetical protein WCB96_09330 [Candidatus Aminicenantales bacterium]